MNDTIQMKQYNLPGYGLIKPQLFPHTQRVYKFLDDYGYIQRLKEVNQLGALRDVFEGAHHTRYEYVIVQLALITELCHLKGHQPPGFNLSSTPRGFSCLPGIDKGPTNGEILQVMTLLSNIGHLPSTFAAERALLHFFDENTAIRRKFRSGLPRVDRRRFDELVSDFNSFNLNYYIALFLINRYKRRANGTAMADFCSEIIRSYLTREDNGRSRGVVALWSLYRNIRRFAYLALDSLYTPVPFSLDLSSIFLSLENYKEDVFKHQSVFQRALEGLEKVMRDTVYLAPESLLQLSRVSEAIANDLENQPVEFQSLKAINNILGPTDINRELFEPGYLNVRVDPESGRTVLLSYRCEKAVSRKVMRNTVDWEAKKRNSVGYRSCRFGAEWDPPHTHLRLSGGISRDMSTRIASRIAFRIGRKLAQFEKKVQDITPGDTTARWQNSEAFLKFLCGAVFGWNYLFRFQPIPVAGHRSVFIKAGSTKTSRLVETFLDSASESELIDADGLNEIRVLKDTLRMITHKGLLFAFAGSTEVLEKENQLAEFDSLIFLFSSVRPYGSVVVVEAKNVWNGHTQARRQLELRMRRLKRPVARNSIVFVGNKGAFAKIEID